MRKANYFTKSELSLFEAHNPVFNDSQMRVINRKTPSTEIEIKTDKNGFKYKSVKSAYIKALVTLVTGGNYSFKVISKEHVTSTNEIIVMGQLTIWTGAQSITREQFGQHYLNLKTSVSGNTTKSYPSEIGNGYKAAASDAFKKCASEFGFCWDIYGQDHAKNTPENTEINHAEKKILERLSFFLEQTKNADDVEAVYNKFLESHEETEATKSILLKNMMRFIKKRE